jgi:hypothetical protein
LLYRDIELETLIRENQGRNDERHESRDFGTSSESGQHPSNSKGIKWTARWRWLLRGFRFAVTADQPGSFEFVLPFRRAEEVSFDGSPILCAERTLKVFFDNLIFDYVYTHRKLRIGENLVVDAFDQLGVRIQATK